MGHHVSSNCILDQRRLRRLHALRLYEYIGAVAKVFGFTARKICTTGLKILNLTSIWLNAMEENLNATAVEQTDRHPGLRELAVAGISAVYSMKPGQTGVPAFGPCRTERRQLVVPKMHGPATDDDDRQRIHNPPWNLLAALMLS